MSKWCECLKREVETCDCPAALPPLAGEVDDLIAELDARALWDSWEIYGKAADALQSLSARLAEAERERDEARERADILSGLLNTTQLCAEKITARAERAEAALRTHGSHLISCSTGMYDRGPCDCGLAAALSPAPAGGQETECHMLINGKDEAARLAILRSSLPASPAPAGGEDGWALVPREPTRAMLNAAIDVDSFKLGNISPLGFRESPQQLFERCYRAMISAAPAKGGAR